MWYVYAVEYYSAMKKQNRTICGDVNGPRDCHTVKPIRKTNTVY